MKNKLRKTICGVVLLVTGFGGYVVGNGCRAEPTRQYIIKGVLEESIYKTPDGTTVYEKHESIYKELPKNIQILPQQDQGPTPKQPLTQEEKRKLPKQLSIENYL